MKTLGSRARMAIVSGILTLLCCTSLYSQPFWINQTHDKAISLEGFKPKTKQNTTLLTSAYFLSVRWPIIPNFVFVGELPFAYGKRELRAVNTKATSKLGNPYLGIELLQQDSPIFVEAGIRLPIVSSSNFANTIGILSDPDRFEAFAPDILTLMALINFHNDQPSNLFFRLRGGPSFLINTAGGGANLLGGLSNEDVELYLLYDGQIGYNFEEIPLHVDGGLTGRLIVTEEGNFGKRTFMQLGFAVRLDFKRVSPGLHLRIPIDDDLKENLRYIVGANLTVNLEN